MNSPSDLHVEVVLVLASFYAQQMYLPYDADLLCIPVVFHAYM